jgi:hypothetical protein
MIWANDDNRVDPEDCCPTCQERDADKLVWQDDGQVRCATSGTTYRPDPTPDSDG